MSADDLFCLPLDDIINLTSPTQRYELTNQWRTTEAEEIWGFLLSQQMMI